MSARADFEGVWWLLSREDRARDGSPRVDPTLGSDALGILTYANGRFAAQFMKRDRTTQANPAPALTGNNNTTALGGYDAYFGTYSLDPATGEVRHRLLAALNPQNVGMEVSRWLSVSDDRLQIRLETTTLDG